MEKLFSASRISELLTGGSGKTAQNYIFDLAMQSIGIKNEIDTPATRHGINNQINAFENVVKPLFTASTWHDKFIKINSYCGASPDILDGNIPTEVKCPYFIDTYLEQINVAPKKYYNQVQMQMISTKSDIGRLIFYLTKPEIWGQEEWNEYPLPLELRHKIFEFKKDEELHDTILNKVEESQPKKLQAIELLKSAELMDEEQFFYEQISGYAYRSLKDCSNIFNLEKTVRVGDNFYYKKASKEVAAEPAKDYAALLAKGKELKKKCAGGLKWKDVY